MEAGSEHIAPTLVFGVRAQIRQASGLPKGAVLRTAAKLVSDPNNQLPPEGAAAPAARQSRFRGPCLKGAMMPARLPSACMLRLAFRRGNRSYGSGFTLLELLVVIAIMAMATAGVSLALRDSSETALEREAQRLAVLFESARAQSRASGVPVYWQTTPDGFRFEGMPDKALPNRWLTEGTQVRGINRVQLGPEPIIGPQVIELVSATQNSADLATPAIRLLRVSTDGLRPFTVQSLGQP